ncbi:Mitochondrial import receptor subunit TOM40-like [Holothuria leucospilota]|uniref:Mitochondrial import receptor subunit TOM40-like n=1 Tax=Holothuria leucospilota TaxID=206669 RepID=A0A9Q1BZ54_HOLLE|nr:Mitochondrial import receptor subunit TOM40-like [Holothuria leucospilota]
MGNVFAAETQKPAGSPAANMTQVPVPEAPKFSPSMPSPNLIPESDALPNPGTFEDLFKKVKELMPNPVEGCKLIINKGLSNHFQVSHSLSMSSFGASSYHFGATYVGSKQISPTEAFPVLLGDIDTTGSLNAQIVHQLADRIRGKFVVQTQQTQWAVYQAETEYRGPSYTGVVTVANMNPLEETGIVVAHYLQSITKRLSLGAELLYHYGQGNQATIISGAAKYATENWFAAGTLGPTSCHLAYYHKGKEIEFGVEFESNFRAQETAVTLGYQIDLPQGVIFKGMVDSNWTVCATLEKRLQPIPFIFTLSALLNQKKDQSRFGFGLMLG